MKIIYSINELKASLNEKRESGCSIGFVPTMGALHNGHLSLVKQCKKEIDLCVVSVFVNPTQFNNKSDLKAYPRNLDKDIKLLESADCDFLFAPSEEEMYPEPDMRVFDFGIIGEVMEGAHRPGHFNGVAQIVSKLFNIVMPDNAYFGEKDYQQISIIREMVKQLNLEVNIVACPIIREDDGLAMSSRNTRLSYEQRQFAPTIARTLKESTTFASTRSVEDVKKQVVAALNNTPHILVEYYEIVDGDTLQPITEWNETENPVGCITVFCGDVRLIDNIKY